MPHSGGGSAQSLVAAAEAASASGDRASADTAWRAVLEVEPAHPRALNHCGNALLRQGDFKGAIDYLARAVSAEPEQPALWFNLAVAQRSAGDFAAALASLERALAIDAYLVQAQLERGRILARLGRLAEAAEAYQVYVDCAPPEVRSDPRIAPLIAEASAVIEQNRRALGERIEARLAESEAEPSAKVSECRDAFLGRHPLFVQQPTLLTVPRLPAEPFFEPSHFPWIEQLEASARVIRHELEALTAAAEDGLFPPYVARDAGLPVNQWGELNHSPRWGAFHLFQNGRKNAENCARCPRTVEIVERLPLVRVAGHSPNVMFSRLKPRTRIPPHTGSTNARATAHLGLAVPAGCGFRVGAETREWREGHAWVFDDTIEHEAWNDSDSDRVILIFDVWNPHLSAAECAQIGTIIETIGAHRGAFATAEAG
jgi:aspartyl/asparaginyl beta-hydroxylase (cupin superfamily)